MLQFHKLNIIYIVFTKPFPTGFAHLIFIKTIIKWVIFILNKGTLINILFLF